MKNIKVVIILLLLNFLNFSCIKKEKLKGEIPFDLVRQATLSEIMEWQNEEKVDITLVKDKMLEIPVDTNSWNHSLYPVYKEIKGKEYFATINKILNGIDFYNLHNQELVNRIVFPKEGEYGISEIGGFYINSKDSIFVFSRNENKIFLSNWQGEAISSYRLPGQLAMKVVSSNFSKFFIEGDNAIIRYIPFAPLHMIGDSLTSYSFNLKDRKGKIIGAPILPSVAKGNFENPIWSEKSVKGANSSIITRFGLLPLIFNYDLNTGEIRTFVLKSKYHRKLASPDDGKGSSMTPYLKDVYWLTLYDPYRSLYYSVFAHEMPEYDESTGEMNELDNKPMSIIIADTLFRYRGEILLENNTYLRSMFVGKEGLYISTANNLNPDESEDLMRFQLFKVKEMQE
jgi:hypothetical protein